MRMIAVILAAFPLPLWADAVVTTRALPARTVIAPGDITTVMADIPGAATAPDQVLGQSLRVALPAGRPLRPQDVIQPAVVARNQTVLLHYRLGGLTIGAEGRALAPGAVGQVLAVMNLSSRGTVQGVVLPDGSVLVNAQEVR